ncbi:translocating chain-associated membrane protein 1-like 1 [Lingula anatina]|uniref:Translocating chain-associated membrane protein 1-like 1 n=1 Tax=Lingula anatina TaxID=7574 RepID=A0A1S3IW44_LINAN|nr:translocating chain-associated membrane protein 1-like 1 [Lingula anatina]|eukprot:XP_013402186.1 translocating chain-associated membrane protein 1-like 1 [Lingula anatina]
MAVHARAKNDFVTSISNLWEGYPHGILQFVIKFYFITQIAYWVHCIPELYFQKVKKEEMMSRITYAALYFVFITGAYLLNFTRVALCMMVLHYFVEAVFHSARLLYFADRTDLANTGFMAWNVLFVLVRLGSITLAVLTFWYGLEQTGVHAVSIKDGNFNTQIVRINCLAAICLLQAWMMWNFITFHLKRMRERSTGSSAARKSGVGKKSKKVKGKKSEDEDSTTENDEGTVSENGSPAVRQRTPKVKRN